MNERRRSEMTHTARPEHALDEAARFYQQGNVYRQQGDWQRALECYAEAVERDPQSPAGKSRQMLLNILNYRCKAIYNP